MDQPEATRSRKVCFTEKEPQPLPEVDPEKEECQLCLANGLSYEKIVEEGKNISSLEMFFSGFPRMVGLSLFPNLTQLTIVGQDIKQIEGLESCPLLRELWVVQCHLTEISGLQNSPQLEKLYLYDNQISAISNLEMQINLKILWLNNNCISHIQGLRTLENLEELNLADNIIEKIGHSLDPNVSLQNLNLSGNEIHSFKELTLLAGLPSLRELALRDATSTPNPVCLLCNYATHVLYHLPGLQRLDTYDVSRKQVKENAESTVLKKMMYYNMRVKTAHRTLEETRLRLNEMKKTLQKLPEERIRALTHALKCLEREVSAIEPNISIKMEALRERLTIWTRKLNEIEAAYERDFAQATYMNEYTVQFLLMELESVGNIRLEEGSPTDSWFNSSCDLLLSRFVPADFKVHGITGIKIDRVIRIFNSALRIRFEDKLHRLLARDKAFLHSQSRNYRRRLEHLFYVPDPEKNNVMEELLCILEDGFKPAEQYKTSETEGGIPQSNSLSVTEQPRIDHALRQASLPDAKHSVDPLPFRHGQIIISKVYVGHSTPAREGKPVDSSLLHRVCSVYHSVDTKHRSATSDERPRSTQPHTGPECGPRRRQWLLFDRALVLPEYLVFFHYVTRKQDQPESLEDITGRDETSNIVLDKDALTMYPVLKTQSKLLRLDDKLLLYVAKANSLIKITVLNLHGNSLSSTKEISRLASLRHLTISFNEFTRLDDMSQMPNLEFLDVSYNHLVTLEGLKGLGQLKQLNVQWNQLTRAREEAAVLRKHTPSLLMLNTSYNPWNRQETVRKTILGCLTTLTHLDDLMVTEEEAADAVAMAADSKITQESLLAHSCTNINRPRGLSLLPTAQLLCLLNPEPWGLDLDLELEPDWTEMLTALNLDNQRISKLMNLNKLVNLRWASFNDNDISKLEGLENCLKLEELSLNNNNISTLRGLSKLLYLKKLSLDGNQLSTLDAPVLDELPNLTFLSMENNRIISLCGIQRVRSLLELYMGNNQISTSRDVYFLRGLSKLIILDLYGNPFVEKLENYRIYVVFHLSSLKALDGIAVEVTESENAKDMFGGRLTSDMVAEKLGHSNYRDITYLTLHSCSIRIVDLSPVDVFVSLRSVNLDHNNLTSFSGLVHLPNIKALCLNYNRIESILPRQRTQAHLTNRQILHSKVHSSGYGQSSSRVNRETGPTGCREPLMGSLEVLHLSHNGIYSLANLQLSRLTNLKALFLQDNEICQVEGLEGLHQLRELSLDRNHIKSLSENSFVSQNLLLELHLEENRIRELSHLNPLTELHKLFLGMNRLQEVTELDKLEVLPSLTELSVVGNPVARNSAHRAAVVLHLSQLQFLDGVTVTLEERTKAELLNCDPTSSGPSVSTTEINLPGLLPIVPRNPLRGINVKTGVQSFMHGRDTLSTHVDEAHPHHTFKQKKIKQGVPARSGHTDHTLRPVRRPGSFMPTTSLLSDGNRVVVSHHNQEQCSRFPNARKHPPK